MGGGWFPGDSAFRWAPAWVLLFWIVALPFLLRHFPTRARTLLAVMLVLLSLEVASIPALNGTVSRDRMAADPLRIWWNPANDTSYGTNSQGFRNVREIGQKTRPRVLAVGDSWVFGKGVGPTETWPAQLEQATGYEVVNAGCPGYCAYQAWLTLQEPGLSLEPDVLVVSNVRNHVQNATFQDLGMEAAGPWKRMLYKSHLYLWLRREYHRSLMRVPPERANELKTPEWTFDIELARRMIHLARENGIQVVMLLVEEIPGANWRYLHPYEALATQLGVPVVKVDMSDPRRRPPDDAVHPDAEGHRQIAEALAPEVRKLIESR